MKFHNLDETIEQLVEKLRVRQQDDGSWKFPFEGSTMTNAYMIILLRVLDVRDQEELIKQLAENILNRQERNGAWKLYHDEKGGNVSATIECLLALISSRYYPLEQEELVKARQYIQRKGGLTQAEWLTKAMLACTGQTQWHCLIKAIPIEVILLPDYAPVNIYSIVGYARVHWVPIIICSSKNYSISPNALSTTKLSELFPTREKEQEIDSETRHFLDTLKNQAMQLCLLPQKIKDDSYHKAESFILERVESNGTLYSYFSSTFFMIFSLLAIGYPKNHPTILKALSGLLSFATETKAGIHIENSPSTIWDTALISQALQLTTAKISMVDKANSYLLMHQHKHYSDWSLKCLHTEPGGWGFSPINSQVPDVDDTTAALRALTRGAVNNQETKMAWQKGTKWLLAMQNRDGGWPAFERDTENKYLSFISFRYEDRVLFDPSTADLTGRTLQYLGSYTNVNLSSNPIQKGIKWLVNNQEEDGSWYGRWGICYIYGTWAALTGLAACGINPKHPSIKKGVKWLESIQNKDGGWGESCASDIRKKYIPLYASTPSQTAWALDALIANHEQPTDSIILGMKFLIHCLEKDNWTAAYPTGAGLPGGFYIHYHSYNYIWPLQTLANYKQKYLS